jgi:hypothetical protein
MKLTCPFRSVSVWPDELTPDCAAFSHGLEWASRLRLPLRLVVPDKEPPTARAFAAAEGESDGMQKKESILERLRQASNARGVTWDGAIRSGQPETAVERFLRAGELCVFANAMPHAIKELFLWRSLRDASVSLLICPRAWQPMRKLLVVQEARNSRSRFWGFVVEVCTAFRVAPTVLTVARDEEQARCLQQSAAQVLTAIESLADFDFLVGADILTAVAVAARCRRCTHVMLERSATSSRFSWFRADTLSRLLDQPDTLTYLAVPSIGEEADVQIALQAKDVRVLSSGQQPGPRILSPRTENANRLRPPR